MWDPIDLVYREYEVVIIPHIAHGVGYTIDPPFALYAVFSEVLFFSGDVWCSLSTNGYTSLFYQGYNDIRVISRRLSFLLVFRRLVI